MPHNTRDKIIDTVIRLYSQYSYEEISTKQIIEEVGISKGTLYWYFERKENMFNEAFERCLKKSLEYSRAHIDEKISAIDCLKQRLKNLVILNKIDPYCIKIIFKHLRVVAPCDTMFYRELGGDIANYVKKGLRNKEIINLPETFLFNVIINNHRMFFEYLNQHHECYNNEPLIDQMIDSLYKSIQR